VFHDEFNKMWWFDAFHPSHPRPTESAREGSREVSRSTTTESRFSRMEAVNEAFKKLNIAFHTHQHEIVDNIADWSGKIKESLPNVMATKTMLAKPKSGNALLIIAGEASNFSVSTVGKAVGAKEPRLAQDNVLQSLLGVDKNDASPFSLVNVKDKDSVTVILDQSLQSASKLAFRSAKRDEALIVSGQDLTKFLESVGVAITPLDFASLAASAPPAPKEAKEAKEAKPAKETKPAKEAKKEDGEKESKMGVEYKKNENLSMWYQQVLLRSEMLDYYDVSGCYIIRPWAYKVWKEIQSAFTHN